MMTRPHLLLLLALPLALALPLSAADPPPQDPLLQPWRSDVTIQPVAPGLKRHSIHAYFNTCPESPDGRYVLYYTSPTPEGESGDIRIRERATGEETILATGITTEDAHRAACQHWSNGGKTVVYHDYRDGVWQVMAVDIADPQPRVLATNRQVAFGNPNSPWAPVYGCHWNPGPHRDLQRIHVETGEVQTMVKAADVVAEYGDYIRGRFLSDRITLFFPIMSPDDQRVFFKLALPSGGDDFRSKQASSRDGLVIYDLEQQRFLRLMEKWGHPSWSPDSQAIFNKGNTRTDIATGKATRYARSCFTNHPSLSPDGQLFVTDADVTKRELGNPGDWAIGVGSTQIDDHVVIHVFGNTKGARTWRPNHPHPIFSADGQRIYYNINEGKWTTLMVAERATDS